MNTFIVMKSVLTVLAMFCIVFSSSGVQAQTLNWGNLVGGSIATSTGIPIDDTFVFEVGAFTAEFVPEFENVSQWHGNWRAFDRAEYDVFFGFSTESAYIHEGVTSREAGASPLSFAGLDAYIWIRNSDVPAQGSEWLLTRASTWKFPSIGGTCCDTTILEWSVSDLNSSTTPKIGSHHGVAGPGLFTPTGTTEGLQTHTFVPEPSSALFTGFAGLFAMMWRRRNP